jgi:hypothetical protein
MGYSKEDFDDVLNLVRPIALSDEELVLREFSDIKELLNSLKKEV